MATLIGKISVGTIKIRPAALKKEGQAVEIAHIYGYATGIKQIADKIRGDIYEALVGEFGAKNIDTEEEFQSSILYLPTALHLMVANAVKKLPPDEPSAAVDFALSIRVVVAKNPAGYSYEAVNLIPARVKNPLEDLKAQIAEVANQGKVLGDGKAVVKK